MTFKPDWATHPGEHLEEYLGARDLSLDDFFTLTGIVPDVTKQLILGDIPLTQDMANAMEKVFGLKASIWMGIQENWNRFCKENMT